MQRNQPTIRIQEKNWKTRYGEKNEKIQTPEITRGFAFIHIFFPNTYKTNIYSYVWIHSIICAFVCMYMCTYTYFFNVYMLLLLYMYQKIELLWVFIQNFLSLSHAVLQVSFQNFFVLFSLFLILNICYSFWFFVLYVCVWVYRNWSLKEGCPAYINQKCGC